MLREDTIVALSSPPGRGAISVIRVSGSRAASIVGRVLHAQGNPAALVPFRPRVGQIVDDRGQGIDEVVVTFFAGPRSYTGEDVIEISCHGNPILVEAILGRLTQAGARLAEPGEFTLRAFLNGKRNLAQAEAVRDLIEARTMRQAEMARRQMEGSLARRLAPIREKLLDLLVQLETAVEFVEESVTPRHRSALTVELKTLESDLSALAATYERGRLLCEGWVVVLTGRPNVGKSSLFNRLLAEERAIVTDVPGTTRDTLRETLDLQGIPVTVLDTAGLRQPRGRVESEGVRRTTTAVAEAQVILLVLDAAAGWTAADTRIWNQLAGKRVLLVWNKIDLPGTGVVRARPRRIPQCLECRVSARTGEGIDELEETLIRAVLPDGLGDDDQLITRVRHRDSLLRCRAWLAAGGKALQEGLSEEYVIADLRQALAAIGEITGETAVEDILGRIFSQFCIGK